MINVLLPSAEQMFVAWASAVPELVAIQATRIGTKLKTQLPATRITRVGNPPPEEWQDLAAIQVECWGTGQDDADRLTRSYVAALPSIRGYVGQGGKVWAYEITSGPYWAPDDPNISQAGRYIFTVDLVITATGGN